MLRQMVSCMLCSKCMSANYVYVFVVRWRHIFKTIIHICSWYTVYFKLVKLNFSLYYFIIINCFACGSKFS